MCALLTQPPQEGVRLLRGENYSAEGTNNSSTWSISQTDTAIPASGYVFHATNVTEAECLQKRLLGSSAKNLARLRNTISSNTEAVLFLYNFQSAKLIGAFRAAGPPGHKLQANAWGGRFPTQVWIEAHPRPMGRENWWRHKFGDLSQGLQPLCAVYPAGTRRLPEGPIDEIQCLRLLKQLQQMGLQQAAKTGWIPCTLSEHRAEGTGNGLDSAIAADISRSHLFQQGACAGHGPKGMGSGGGMMGSESAHDASRAVCNEGKGAQKGRGSSSKDFHDSKLMEDL